MTKLLSVPDGFCVIVLSGMCHAAAGRCAGAAHAADPGGATAVG